MDGLSLRWLRDTARAVLSHPALWSEGLRTLVRLAPKGWWRRAPYLPVPAPAYVKFRAVTNHGGDGSAPPTADEVLAYLKWCRSMRRVLE